MNELPIPSDERLLRKIYDNTIILPNGCWEFQGCCGTNGYGQVKWKGQQYGTHRVSLNSVKKIPEGMLVCHTCDYRRCVNPEHLFLGTNQDNTIDSLLKGRHNHPKGETNGRAILTQANVREIRSLYAETYITQSELGERYGVDRTTIGNIIQGRTWIEPEDSE
jgi:HNH endonuclease